MQKLRRKKYIATALFLVSSSLITSCANRQYATPEEAAEHACSALGPKALSGALVGGLAGAAGGAAIGAAAGGGRNAGYGALAGLVTGLLVGAIAGHTADHRDCEAAQAAIQQAGMASVGTRIAWNSASGSYGSIMPVSEAQTVNGRVCREIRSDYYIKNHEPVVGEPGLVCRTSNGDWARVGQQS